jgi:hypothetical protein
VFIREHQHERVGFVLGLLALGIAVYLGRVLAQWSAAFALGAAILRLAAGLAAIFGPALRRNIPHPEIKICGSGTGALVYNLCYTNTTITIAHGSPFLLLTIPTEMGHPAHGALFPLLYVVGRDSRFFCRDCLLGLSGCGLRGWIGCGGWPRS